MNDRPDDPLDRPVRSVIRAIVDASPAPGAVPAEGSPTQVSRSARTRHLVLVAASLLVVGGVAGSIALATRSSSGGTTITLAPAAATEELAEAQALLESGRTESDTIPTSVPGDTTPTDSTKPGTVDGGGVTDDPTRPPVDSTPDPSVPNDTTPITVILSNYTVFDVSAPSEVRAGESLLLEWSVEASDGVDVTTARVGGASGWVSWCPFPMIGSRTSGTDTNGRYRAGCTVPATAPNGTYTVFFQASTLVGSSDGPLGTAEVSFEVVAGSSDNDVPTFSAVSAPTTARRGDSITFTWRSTDESGVDYAIGWMSNGGFALADGTRVVDYGDLKVTRISGNEFDGVYSQTIRFTDRSPLGTYTLWFSRRDSVGNKSIDESSVHITLTE
jgi:hypothetical protein